MWRGNERESEDRNLGVSLKKRKNLLQIKNLLLTLQSQTGSDARVAEEARLESVYTPKAYPEFESRSLRINKQTVRQVYEIGRAHV